MGVPEPLSPLRTDAHFWLVHSGGQTRVVILISVNKTTRVVKIERWGHMPRTRPTRRQSPKYSPTKMQALSLRSNGQLTGGPLCIPAFKIFDVVCVVGIRLLIRESTSYRFSFGLHKNRLKGIARASSYFFLKHTRTNCCHRQGHPDSAGMMLNVSTVLLEMTMLAGGARGEHSKQVVLGRPVWGQARIQAIHGLPASCKIHCNFTLSSHIQYQIYHTRITDH